MQHDGRYTLRGFTLLELMVAMTLSVVTVGAAGSIYIVQQRQYSKQRMLHAAWHNLWGGLQVMEKEIRKAGYDPEDSGAFGITDVRRYDLVNAKELSPQGQPVLFYTCDVDENGGLDLRHKGHNREHPKFRISDVQGNGRVCLTWDNGSGRRPLADHIQAMGFAFALDRDGDGCLDAAAGTDHVIWAVDSDNDNLLDANIDTNTDGILDERDDTNRDGKIDWADGGKLDQQVQLGSIRVVRVWLLVTTAKMLMGHVDRRRHVVGDRVYKPAQDGYARLVVSSTIVCRNL
jgi:prepilin-type N-terminal cleavage/methylation domain-containing protein